MLTIGCHLSKRRGYLEMAKEAASINANTFQYFTRSPRGSEQAALDEKDVAAYLAFAKEHGIHDALAYAPYDADPATDKMNERDFALMVYSEDLARLAEVDGSLYLIRPGSRLNISVEEGLADVADALNKIITPSMKTCVLLDTMAGEGTQVGTSFEQLAAIIAKVEHPEHVGVCFDCAGVWAEGYDIVGDLDGVLEEFDRTIGLNKLKAVHLNDATHERGSHVDRHARIGEGKIGFDALAALVNHPKLAGVPFYLRTGKRLGKRVTEIAVVFKRAPHLPFESTATKELGKNAVVIRVQPDEGVTMRFGAKVPGGTSMEVRDVSMDFGYGRSFTESSPEAYERLILDVLLGDPPLFPTTEEVNLSWKILDPIEEFWSTLGQPQPYRSGTWGPEEAVEMLARDGHRWRMP